MNKIISLSIGLTVVAASVAAGFSQVETPSSKGSATADEVPTGYPVGSVRPPKLPHVTDELSPAAVAKLPVPKQSPELAKQLASLSEGSLEERIEKLKKKVLADLVFVEGGAYMMGDFGQYLLANGLPIAYGADNKPAHKVTVSSFSIAKYKTTYAEFDVFTDATGQTREGSESDGEYRYPTIPVGTYWPTAKAYCGWLGKITGQPFDLPYEAQWEFAARSRGQFFIAATDDGNIEQGKNIVTGYQMELISPIAFFGYHVGIFPPNPLGLYDMSSNGFEWMNDWYDAKYYSYSPMIDPKGPLKGTKRVLRSVINGDPIETGSTVHRNSSDPYLIGKNVLTGKIGPGIKLGRSLRCVVNSPQAVN